MKKRVVLVVWIIVLITVLSGILYYYSTKDLWSTSSASSHSQETTNTKKVYEHINPERVSKNEYFKWEFIANDVASIYPRRDALVKDILVDIWDTVKVWQTLALLFEPWVEWQSNSSIAVKSTQVNTKKNLLWDIVNVKNARLWEVDTKINEKNVLISETSKLYDSKIAQVQSSLKNKDNIEVFNAQVSTNNITVEKKNLETLEQNLVSAELSSKQRLQEVENNIDQKEVLFDTKIEEIYLSLFPIFYIGSDESISYWSIRKSQLSNLFWVKDSVSRNNLLQTINTFITQKSDLSSTQRYEQLLAISEGLIESLQNTLVSVDITESSINTAINSVNTYKQSLVTYKEGYDDAQSDLSTQQKIEAEKIETIKKQIEKQKEVILLTKSQYEVVNSSKDQILDNLELEIKKLSSEKSLQVEKLKAELNTLIQSKKLLGATENKNITAIKNDISLAQADLNKEYIQSKDYKIVSPFSGVISKRSIEVGQKVSQNMESFRLGGVSTSLSKITKKEIKFYIPEHVRENIKIDKQVYFSLWDDSWKTFTGSVLRISPEVDPETLTITVQAQVDDEITIPHKSVVRVWLETQQDIFRIPTSSIYNKGERKIIYYKKDNWKLWVRDISIISGDWEFSLVSWEMSEETKLVITPIFVK